MTRPRVTGWHQAGTDIRKRSCVILIAKPVPRSVTVFGTGLRRCDTQGGAGLHGLTAGGRRIRTVVLPVNELVSGGDCECEPGAKDGLVAVVYLAGTKGSNPSSSSGESANHRFLSGGARSPQRRATSRRCADGSGNRVEV